MIEKEMEDILRERKNKHIEDDYGIQFCWDKMVNILAKNENETITYLSKCDKVDLYYISEIFEDISEQLQSSDFIECLRILDEKYSELEMKKDIDMAEEYIN